MKEIALTKGYVTQVDDEDFEWLSQFFWSAVVSVSANGLKRYVYAARFGKPKKRMHREIMGISDSRLVDHWDGDGLNNQRYNLRTATRGQNMQNSDKKVQVGLTSRYKGVNLDHTGLFLVHIQYGGKLHRVGAFRDEVDAATAYNIAAVNHFGEFARLNS